MSISAYSAAKKNLIVSAIASILVVLSIFIYGYEYGTSANHMQILPFIEKIRNPALFPNDYFVNTLNRFPSIYPYVMAFLSKWIGLEALHLILYLIFKFALLIFAYSLARFLFRSRRTGIIAMFLFAFSPLINAYGLLGHDPLMKASFYQTSAVAPFAVAAILMFLRKKYTVTYIILACIYYVNALIGNFLLVLFLFASAYEYSCKKNTAGLKNIIYPLFLFVVLIIPGAAWIARLNITNPVHASENFSLYLKLWFTGHYFPSFFTAHQWYYFAVICIFFVIFFRRGFGYCREKNIIRIFLFVLVDMWLLAAVFGEVLPIRGLILLQFLRSDVLFIVLGITFAADYIRSMLDSKSARGIAIGGLIVLALIEFSKPPYIEFILIALILTEFEISIKNFLQQVTTDAEESLVFLWTFFAIFLITFSAASFFIYKASPKMGCFLIFSIALAMAGKKRALLKFKNGCMA
ncbi:MAG: hypothetical protein WC522_08835 [Candidatus Omnitrophota bacterium]